MDATNSDEEALTGGNASASVVRIGDTVRKPWLPTTHLTPVGCADFRPMADRRWDLLMAARPELASANVHDGVQRVEYVSAFPDQQEFAVWAVDTGIVGFMLGWFLAKRR